MLAGRPAPSAGPQPVGCPCSFGHPEGAHACQHPPPTHPGSVHTQTPSPQPCFNTRYEHLQCCHPPGDSPEKRPRHALEAGEVCLVTRVLESWHPVCDPEGKRGLQLNKSLWPRTPPILWVNQQIRNLHETLGSSWDCDECTLHSPSGEQPLPSSSSSLPSISRETRKVYFYKLQI